MIKKFIQKEIKIKVSEGNRKILEGNQNINFGRKTKNLRMKFDTSGPSFASTNTAFSVGQCFGKNAPPTSATHLELSTNLQ